MNDRFSQFISPAWKLNCRTLTRILRRSIVINTVGDDSVLRMKPIISLLVKWLGLYVCGRGERGREFKT